MTELPRKEYDKPPAKGISPPHTSQTPHTTLYVHDKHHTRSQIIATVHQVLVNELVRKDLVNLFSRLIYCE